MSLRTLVCASPPMVATSWTRTFFAFASFLANFFFGYTEMVTDLPALALPLAMALSAFSFVPFLATALSLNLQPPGLASAGHLSFTLG